jgi:hypothetical protein
MFKAYLHGLTTQDRINGVDWTDLAQDRDKWPTLENAVMKLWVPQISGNFWAI